MASWCITTMNPTISLSGPRFFLKAGFAAVPGAPVSVTPGGYLY